MSHCVVVTHRFGVTLDIQLLRCSFVARGRIYTYQNVARVCYRHIDDLLDERIPLFLHSSEDSGVLLRGTWLNGPLRLSCFSVTLLHSTLAPLCLHFPDAQTCLWIYFHLLALLELVIVRQGEGCLFWKDTEDVLSRDIYWTLVHHGESKMTTIQWVKGKSNWMIAETDRLGPAVWRPSALSSDREALLRFLRPWLG